jgi:SAM-dependent methyltransferase
MSRQSRKVFERLYGSATTCEELPWHAPEPPALLVKALGQRQGGGSALDVGCGAGTFSLYMAQRGYDVTAVDFMPQAVAMLKQRAADANLNIDVFQADIGQWKSPTQFDVMLDVGCLHTPGTIDPALYKQQLLKWLAPGGDFVLLHFGRRGWWDQWPVGPGRVYRETVVSWFEPQLELVEYVPEYRTGIPLLLGRSALIGHYWFRRA